jgi:hypothetical protein
VVQGGGEYRKMGLFFQHLASKVEAGIMPAGQEFREFLYVGFHMGETRFGFFSAAGG